MDRAYYFRAQAYRKATGTYVVSFHKVAETGPYPSKVYSDRIQKSLECFGWTVRVDRVTSFEFGDFELAEKSRR
jgi:hypothetical protein